MRRTGEALRLAAFGGFVSGFLTFVVLVAVVRFSEHAPWADALTFGGIFAVPPALAGAAAGAAVSVTRASILGAAGVGVAASMALWLAQGLLLGNGARWLLQPAAILITVLVAVPLSIGAMMTAWMGRRRERRASLTPGRSL